MTQSNNLSKPTRASLLAAALACTALTPTTAFAQTETAIDEEDDVIVVTTQRREQNILDVPYNITVLSGEDISESITLDSAELLRAIPGASQIDDGPRSFQFNSIRIRGLNVDRSNIGDFLLGSVPTVATYVNETPVFANLALIDLDRVEVQRGPQATLYGSGALGGTVKYFTNKPQFGETSGSVTVTSSTTEGSDGWGYSTGGILNVPVSDKFALRANVLWQDYPGITDYTNLYVLDADGVPTQPLGLFASGPTGAEFETEEDADDFESLYLRLSARLAPTDDIDIVASYFYQDDKSGGRRQPSLGNDGFGEPYGEYDNGAVIREPAEREFNMFALEAEVDLGFATLTSASSYYENEGESETDNTGFFASNLAQFYPYINPTVYTFPRPLYTADRTFTDESFIQELRLVSNEPGPIDYVVGLYYQDQERGQTQVSDLVGFDEWYSNFFFVDIVFTDNILTTSRLEDYEEFAIFGELTWHLSERARFTGGLRYFDNESTTVQTVRSGLYTTFNASDESSFTAKDDDILYRATLDFDVFDDDLLYFTVSEGYRRGGSNGVPTVGNFANDPEWQIFGSDSVTNYEVGLKGTAHGLRYDLSYFMVDWDDPQFNTNAPVGSFFAVVNGSEAQTSGLEAQVTGTGMEGMLNYSVGYAYVDAELTDDFIVPPNINFPTVVNQIASDGAPLPGVAEHSFNVAADYSHPLDNGWYIVSRVDGFYQSETQNVLDEGISNSDEFDGFSIWDLTFTLSTDSWDASLFAKNVFDEEGTTGAFTEAAFGPSPTDDFYGSNSRQFITLPRTYGVAVNYRF